jgi:hypothetical protein
MDNRAYCTIYLDHRGDILEVLDEHGKARQVTPTEEVIPARVGGPAPGGRIITAVSTIDVVTVKGDEGDHDDPCWIRDPRGNWRCVCARPPCP